VRPVAVVTGATRGIGLATARSLAGRGLDLVVVGRSTRDSPNRAGLPGTLEAAAEQTAALGAEVLAVPADLAAEGAAARLAAQVEERFGRCDVLVNNAAVSFLGPFVEVPSRKWRTVLTVNLFAAVELIEAFLPGMIERGAGRIISMGSDAADTHLDSGVHQLPYSASKSAIEVMSRGLARQLAGTGIAVNALRPNVATEAVTMHAPQLLDDPTGRWASTAAYGEAVAWLAEQPATFTGHLLTNDDLKAAGALAG
jgi:citronellol/citronellal dehydrogenase